jgi:hypothetical protein
MNIIKCILRVVGYVALLATLIVAATSCTTENNQSDNNENGTQAILSKSNGLVARSHNSDFEMGGTSWVSTSAASDGKIYYTISTSDVDQGARIYVHNPKTGETKYLADLTEVCGEKDLKAIPQGKSHSNFYEKDGILYTSTHVGVHGSIEDGELAITKEGYLPYPGGHFISYNLSTGEFEDLGVAVVGEGIVTMTMDQDRGHLYGITWPRGYFVHYDLEAGKLKNLGLVSERGEAGTPGVDFNVLNRAMVVDPRDGSVYYSIANGDIFAYSPYSESIRKVEGVNLRLDYFGKFEPNQPGSLAYNWRRVIWYPEEEVIYGLHSNSGYLFRFDPSKPKIELVERFLSEPSRISGMYSLHPYGGYLGFDLGPDGETLYHLTSGPIYKDGQRMTSDQGKEMGLSFPEIVHLVTYNIPNKKYVDHGPIYHENGSLISDAYSIAVTSDAIYTLASFERGDDKRVVDLIEIPNPFKK